MSLRPMLSLPTTSMKRTLTVAIASAALLTAAHASAQTLRFAHVDPRRLDDLQKKGPPVRSSKTSSKPKPTSRSSSIRRVR